MTDSALASGLDHLHLNFNLIIVAAKGAALIFTCRTLAPAMGVLHTRDRIYLGLMQKTEFYNLLPLDTDLLSILTHRIASFSFLTAHLISGGCTEL